MEKKKLNESGSMGLAFIKPSVERWLMDQIDGNHPKTIEDVRRYLKAEDPGTYKLSTRKGDPLMQDLVNFYIRSKVSWLNQNLTVIISKQGKLGILNESFPGFHIITGYTEYDFNKSFTSNLADAAKESVKNLLTETSQPEFNSRCLDAVNKLKKSGKKTVYLYEDIMESAKDKSKNSYQLFENYPSEDSTLVPVSFAQFMYEYQSDGIHTRYIAEPIGKYIMEHDEILSGPYGELVCIRGNTDTVYDNVDFYTIHDWLEANSECTAGWGNRGIAENYWYIMVYEDAIVTRRGSSTPTSHRGPTYWTVIAMPETLKKLMELPKPIRETAKIHKHLPKTNETKSIDELEGHVVRGTWKGDKLILDDTKEEYNVGVEAPVKCHKAFRVSHGSLIAL